MFDRKQLKNRAKSVLMRSYFTAFIACLIFGIISGGGIGLSARRIQNINFEAMSYMRILAIFSVIVLLALISVIFSVFLVAPLKVGLKKFMISAAEGDARLDNMLFPFRNNYKNITLVQFMKNLFIFLWSLPGFIPTALGIWKFHLADRIIALMPQIRENSVSASFSLLMILAVWFFATLVFSVPSIIKELQYTLTEYILADNPTYGWRDAIGRSKDMMVGNKWAYIKLLLSFAGWYIAANLFCCIGSFLLNPYIEATVAEMYLELCGRGTSRDGSYTPPFPNGFGF